MTITHPLGPIHRTRTAQEFESRFRAVLMQAANDLEHPDVLLRKDYIGHLDRISGILDRLELLIQNEGFIPEQVQILQAEALYLRNQLQYQLANYNDDSHLQIPINFYSTNHASGTISSPKPGGRPGGRPTVTSGIDPAKIHEARLQGYTLEQIAAMSYVSRSTLYRLRRRQEHPPRTTLDSQELDQIVSQILHHTPNLGIIMVKGALRAQGYLIPDRHVHACIKRLDPLRSVNLDIGISKIPQRIPYQVPTPNSLWHFDGNHKLRRWGIVIHGCVDGYKASKSSLQFIFLILLLMYLFYSIVILASVFGYTLLPIIIPRQFWPVLIMLSLNMVLQTAPDMIWEVKMS